MGDTGTQSSERVQGEDFKEAFLDFSRGDQELSDFGDCLTVRPMVDELLSWLGVQVLQEQEWEDGLRAVLEEMTDERLLTLYDRRLQIEIRDHDCSLVRAYFPMYRHEWLAEYIVLEPTTQILLVISATRVEDRPTALFKKILRHQIGHVLRYLQHPTWPNECYQAKRAWKKWSKSASLQIHNSDWRGLKH